MYNPQNKRQDKSFEVQLPLVKIRPKGPMNICVYHNCDASRRGKTS